MAKPKPKPKPKFPKPKPRKFKPADYLSGSQTVGQNYTAWDTYGQGKPDFGKGAGPGEPYRQVTKKNTGQNLAPIQRPVQGPSFSQPGPQLPKYGKRGDDRDPRVAAIRRRLGWA